VSLTPNQQKWVDALRSGEFKQAQDSLRTTVENLDEISVGYCCLGVACEVFRRETDRGRWTGEMFQVDDCTSGTSLPGPVQDWLGIFSSAGELKEFVIGNGYIRENIDLTDFNDGRLSVNGVTKSFDFNAIADVIESNAGDLFEEQA
jgi:hypothetical protein